MIESVAQRAAKCAFGAALITIAVVGLATSLILGGFEEDLLQHLNLAGQFFLADWKLIELQDVGHDISVLLPRQ